MIDSIGPRGVSVAPESPFAVSLSGKIAFRTRSDGGVAIGQERFTDATVFDLAFDANDNLWMTIADQPIVAVRFPAGNVDWLALSTSDPGTDDFNLNLPRQIRRSDDGMIVLTHGGELIRLRKGN